MKRILFYILITYPICMATAQFEPNYDETKVPKFEASDLLTTFDGKKVNDTSGWENTRRPELYHFFEEQVYGKVPGKLDSLSFEVVEGSTEALGGKAIRKQIEVDMFKNGKSLSFHILLYLPNNGKASPIFLGYNFYGNHTITDDSNVIISNAWAMDNEDFGISDNTLTKASRGVRTHRWAIEKIIDGGFGLATIYYGEVDPDKNDFSDGLHRLFYEEGQTNPKADEWGSIAAWAFGMSRALDYLETDSDVDAHRVISFGHSRLGKAALWAGASDQRFAAVISNNSGCGGAALSKRKFGETVGRINARFPHWFSDTFTAYNDNEEALAIDQHGLLAQIAPRPLYVASAEDDQWADPRGEYLSAHYVTPVYQLYGKKGLARTKMPQTGSPVHHTVAYHIRTGKHDVTEYDWEQYISWAKKFVAKEE
ncbi:acetylxylan esterase [Pricia sp. S334]|uniref:Acetylxylan esterase n=1 Tax=Pricia mediterranea TaxID=3076079 RepID=A0ABU3L3Q4_9FLAO|nr:acetylxylan esterase [Pricia sp. S334]MDT7828198.1 acetylxylan esterase [Pricia sp. S334]